MEAVGWLPLIGIGSVVIVGVGLVLANSSRFFTLREHEAYLRSQVFVVEAMSKRIDDVLDLVKTIEHTSPTTGELKAWVTRRINGEEDQ